MISQEKVKKFILKQHNLNAKTTLNICSSRTHLKASCTRACSRGSHRYIAGINRHKSPKSNAKTSDMYWFTDYYNTTDQTGGFYEKKIIWLLIFSKLQSFIVDIKNLILSPD